MKHVVVSFSLSQANQTTWQSAYQALASLGLTPIQNGIGLPSGTVMGVWWTDVSSEEIRATLIYALNQAGVNPAAIIVAKCEEAAWWGPPIK